MARIIGKKVKWINSTSTDVVATRIYICKQAETLSYDSPHVSVAAPATEYTLPGAFTNLTTEGNYKVGLSAVDANSNESDIIPATGKVFFWDLTAPVAPTGLQIVNT
jgi:hypothetical protein